MSWQSALACWFLRKQFRPQTLRPDINVEKARALTAKRVWSPKVPAGWRLRELQEAKDWPLQGEWIERVDGVPSVPTQPTVLYCHGGGYYFCSPRTHRSLVFGLATRANAPVFSLDYRLAPEHRFPAALDDAIAAYRRLVADGTPPESIVISGDSAGGGLALAEAGVHVMVEKPIAHSTEADPVEALRDTLGDVLAGLVGAPAGVALPAVDSPVGAASWARSAEPPPMCV